MQDTDQLEHAQIVSSIVSDSNDGAGDEFQLIFKTDNTGPSNDDQVTLPLVSTGTYDFTIDWGDGTSDTITAYDQAEVTHTYSSAGTYYATITGTCTGWRYNNGGDRLKLIGIERWGSLRLTSESGAFYGCEFLEVTASDRLITTGITNMAGWFRKCALLNVDLDYLDTSAVTTMANMFREANLFNGNIVSWDTSNVTTFNGMFYSANQFNRDIGNWDTSSVTGNGFELMFFDATLFNQDLSGWDVSGGTVFDEMFHDAKAFNQNLSSWDMSGATSTASMFRDADAFNSPVAWTNFSPASINSMFRDTAIFDQDLSGWDATDITNAFSFMSNSGGLSTANYDALLIGWEAQAVNNNVTLNMGTNATYTAGGAAAAARAALIADHSWTITDGGSV